MPTAFRLCAAAALMSLVSAPARAQGSGQAAPKALAAAAAPAADLSDDRVLAPMLKGLVFVTRREALQPNGVALEGLQASGTALLETAEFRALASPFLGRPLTQRSLDRLTREVVLHFRQRDRPVVDVFVPEQNISTGTVQILVVEGRLGEVRVEGNKWFSNEQIVSSVRARPGEVIAGAPLLADLAWINENSFREVDLVFTRGQAAGQTDIILRTRDRLPLRGYLGYEDTGNALTGYDRVLAGLNWGNAFNRDHQLNYQLSASPDFEKLVAHSGSYIVPLRSWRHTLTIFGSYAESRPELANGLFALTGRTKQLSARYRVPLAAQGMWTRGFTAGVDFKRSNNDLSFGGTRVFAQENDVVQAVATYAVSHLDRHGAMSGALTLAYSPGGLTSRNDRPAYTAARALARPDYVYARLDLERRRKLPREFSWLARATAQLSSANLLGSEQLGLGGASNLRGYEEREANGDDGVVLVNELHGPPLFVSAVRKPGSAPRRLAPLAFLDGGLVRSHARLPGEPSRLTLASAGVGLRYHFGTLLQARLDYGWQLKDSGVSDGRRSHRAHAAVTVSF